MIKTINTVINEIECYGPRKQVQAGDNVAVLLPDVKLEDIKRGDIIVKQNNIAGIGNVTIAVNMTD